MAECVNCLRHIAEADAHFVALVGSEFRFARCARYQSAVRRRYDAAVAPRFASISRCAYDTRVTQAVTEEHQMHKCTQCDKEFKKPGGLERHIAREHSGGGIFRVAVRQAQSGVGRGH